MKEHCWAIKAFETKAIKVKTCSDVNFNREKEKQQRKMRSHRRKKQPQLQRQACKYKEQFEE